MGFIRKALFIATGGLSGLVFKDDAEPARTANAAEKQVRSQKQTKVTRPKPQAARRRKTQAKTQATRTSRAARTAGPGNGTITELERLAALHRRGALTDEEFAAAKAKVLETSLTSHSPLKAPATFPAVEANVAAARHLADLAVHDRGTSIAAFGND